MTADGQAPQDDPKTAQGAPNDEAETAQGSPRGDAKAAQGAASGDAKAAQGAPSGDVKTAQDGAKTTQDAQGGERGGPLGFLDIEWGKTWWRRGFPTVLGAIGVISLLLVGLIEAVDYVARTHDELPVDLSQQSGQLASIAAAITSSHSLVGALLALGVTLLLVATVLWARSPIYAIRRLLAVTGGAVLMLWIVGTVLELDVRPEEFYDAFLIVGAILLVAAVLLHDPKDTEADKKRRLPKVGPRATWLLGLLASLLLIVAASVAGLGVLFDPDVPDTKPAYIVIAVLALLGGVLAASNLLQAAENFDAHNIIESSRFSDVTLVAVLGGLVAGFGLWYGYIVVPASEAPTLDVELAVEQLGSSDGEDILAFTVIAHNRGSSPVKLLASPYRIYAGRLQHGAPDNADNTDAAPGTYQCRVGAEIQEASSLECYKSSEGERPVRVASTSMSVRRQAWVDYTPEQTGQLWSPGQWVDPGSSFPVRLAVALPEGTDVIRFERSVVYAPEARVERDDVGEVPSDCSFFNSPKVHYRWVAIDPIAGLVNALDPTRFEVVWQVDGRETDRGQLRVEVCPWSAGKYRRVDGGLNLSEALRDLGIAHVSMRDEFLTSNLFTSLGPAGRGLTTADEERPDAIDAPDDVRIEGAELGVDNLQDRPDDGSERPDPRDVPEEVADEVVID